MIICVQGPMAQLINTQDLPWRMVLQDDDGVRGAALALYVDGMHIAGRELCFGSEEYIRQVMVVASRYATGDVFYPIDEGDLTAAKRQEVAEFYRLSMKELTHSSAELRRGRDGL